MKINFKFVLTFFLTVPVFTSLLLHSSLFEVIVRKQLVKNEKYVLSDCAYTAHKSNKFLDLSSCGLKNLDLIDIEEILKFCKILNLNTVVLPIYDYFFSNYKSQGPDAEPAPEMGYYKFILKPWYSTIATSTFQLFDIVSLYFSPEQKWKENIFKLRNRSWDFITFRPLDPSIIAALTNLRQAKPELRIHFSIETTLRPNNFSVKNKKQINDEIKKIMDLVR